MEDFSEVFFGVWGRSCWNGIYSRSRGSLGRFLRGRGVLGLRRVVDLSVEEAPTTRGMPEAGDLSNPEIQIFSEEIVTFSVCGVRGRVGDFLQGFVDGKAVFELTSVREVDRILVEERTLEFFTECVVVVILENCFGNVSFVRRMEIIS